MSDSFLNGESRTDLRDGLRLRTAASWALSSSPSVSVISDSGPEALIASSVVIDEVDDTVLMELALFVRAA
jgi:hypothetical protein